MGKKKSTSVIPPPINVSAIQGLTIKESGHQRQEIIDYVEWQINKGKDATYNVIHLEQIKSEVVFGTDHVAWDVHTDEPCRWWVITGPTNLYSQHAFPSLDYTFSFHVGLMGRIASRDTKRAPASRKDRLRDVWRRWETAAQAIDTAKEAEDFQAVGMRCRETLVSLAKALRNEVPLSKDIDPPKAADFVSWSEHIAAHFALGSRNEHIRSYLRHTSKEAWQLVNWLTHSSTASLYEAHLALDATSNLLEMYSLVVMRSESGAPKTCPSCNSYRIVSVYEPELGIDPPYINICESCNWISYEPQDS